MSRREQSQVGVKVKAVLDKAVQSHPRWRPKSSGQGWALHVLRDSRPGARTQTPLQSPVLSSPITLLRGLHGGNDERRPASARHIVGAQETPSGARTWPGTTPKRLDSVAPKAETPGPRGQQSLPTIPAHDPHLRVTPRHHWVGNARPGHWGAE